MLRITFASIALIGFCGFATADELDNEAPALPQANISVASHNTSSTSNAVGTGSELDRESPHAAHFWRGRWGYGGWGFGGWGYGGWGYPAFGFGYRTAFYPSFSYYPYYGLGGFGLGLGGYYGGFYGFRSFGPRFAFCW